MKRIRPKLVFDLIDDHIRAARNRYLFACENRGIVEYEWERIDALVTLRSDLRRIIETTDRIIAEGEPPSPGEADAYYKK